MTTQQQDRLLPDMTTEISIEKLDSIEPAPKPDPEARRREFVNDDGTPTAKGWHLISNKLQQPMETKQRTGRGGKQFNYITARNVFDRLDEVVGPGNWSTKYKIIDVERKVVECTLTVFGVSKSDVGYNNNPEAPEFIEAKDRTTKERIVDETTGEVKMIRNPAWEDEPFKASYSDSLKRAAVQFGIARWLYGD